MLKAFEQSKLRFVPLLEFVYSKAVSVYFVAIIMSSIGLALSLCGFSTAFQRSGALMVSFAVFCVFLNHFVSSEFNERSRLNDHLNERSPDSIKAALLDGNPEMAEEEASRIMAQLGDAHEKIQDVLPRLTEVSHRLVLAEFTCGFIGTLIWGFGDLPFPTV